MQVSIIRMLPLTLSRVAVLGSALALAASPVIFASIVPPGFPALPREFKPAALSPREPEIRIDYPGSAAAHGVTQGKAVISVLVGADGKPIDLVAVQYSDKAFADALLDHARYLRYAPGDWQGTAVASRFELGYQFESASTAVNLMEASRLRMDLAPAKPAYAPVSESKLDQPLEFTNVALPKVPVAYAPPNDEPVKVYVTFYVDEEGKVRAPNVESAASPLLFPGAIKAVRTWTFTPPTVQGKPVLVFAGRSVGFVPRTPAAAALPKTSSEPGRQP